MEYLVVLAVCFVAVAIGVYLKEVASQPGLTRRKAMHIGIGSAALFGIMVLIVVAAILAIRAVLDV